MKEQKEDSLLNQVFKMKRLSGIVIAQVTEKCDNGFYHLKVVKGNATVFNGTELSASSNELLHYSTKMTGSFQS